MNRYLLDRLMDDDRHDRDYRRDRDHEDDDRDRARGGYGGGRGNSRGGNQGSRGRGREGDRRDRRYDDYDDVHDFEYNRDMHDNKPLEIKAKDLKKWEKDLENADGTRGAKFDKDQIIPIAEQHGIKFDKFTKEEFVAAVNMMYADYCEAVMDMQVPNYQKPEPYIHLAKAFLCDEDFEGKPYEKLAIYYYAIVEFEDE